MKANSDMSRGLARVVLCIALAGLPLSARPIEAIDEAELTQGIVNGCLYHSSEFGEAMVRVCIETETAAAKAVLQYPREADAIVVQCMQDPLNSGWSMVKRCADRALASGAVQEKK